MKKTEKIKNAGLPQDFYDFVDGMYKTAEQAGVRFTTSDNV